MKLSTIKHRTNKLRDKKLLAIWSLKVKQIAGFVCEICGADSYHVQLQSHHIVGKDNMTTRYDLRNGICLCAKHHKMGRPSAHQDPIWFIEWLIENRHEDYEYLRVKKNEAFDKDYIRIERELEVNK